MSGASEHIASGTAYEGENCIMACIRASPELASKETVNDSILLKSDVEGLLSLRDSIISDIRELRRLEKAEQSVANRGRSVLHSLSKRDLAPDHHARKNALREKVFAKQRAYLDLQAEIERRISSVPEQTARLMLSWHYVDLLTYKQAAERFGGMTDGGAQMILRRFFAGTHRGRDSP